MRTTDHGEFKVRTETDWRYAVNEMHLFDEGAREEGVFCEGDAAIDYRRSVREYLKDRLHDVPVGPVCECCKIPAPQFAMELAQDMEAEGLLDEAEDYRQLARTLLEETGRNGQDR